MQTRKSPCQTTAFLKCHIHPTFQSGKLTSSLFFTKLFPRSEALLERIFAAVHKFSSTISCFCLQKQALQMVKVLAEHCFGHLCKFTTGQMPRPRILPEFGISTLGFRCLHKFLLRYSNYSEPVYSKFVDFTGTALFFAVRSIHLLLLTL